MERGRDRELVFSGHILLFGDDDKVLEMDSGNGCTTL